MPRDSATAGSGTFRTIPTLQSAQSELAAELQSPNMTILWNTSSRSIWARVEPSGFLPTSVSGGYGGITSEFVRDGAGMIIGMLEASSPSMVALQISPDPLPCREGCPVLPSRF